MRITVAMLLIVCSVFVLERASYGVSVERLAVGQTPVIRYSVPGEDGPVVILAHGFAGSSQMMQGYALPLARAGYRVIAFDFLGHGRHPEPMSGDLVAVDGTTRLLVEQTAAVIDRFKAGKTSIALVGHSMATDVLVRVAAERDDIGPIVLLSAFSRAIDETKPGNLLLATGAWEPGLREFAREAVRMVNPMAEEGETVSKGGVTRRAVVAPMTEHVSILQSRLARQEAVGWLDRFYDRSSELVILPTGHAILGLLAGLVLLFVTVLRLLPTKDEPGIELSRQKLWIVTIGPMIIAPFVATALDMNLLPVLVANDLALLLATYGLVQLGFLRLWGISMGPFSAFAFLALLTGSALIGFALDRYAANFWPTAERSWIIAVMAAGTVPYFIADARLAYRAGAFRRLWLRLSLFASLGIAVALDFEGMFFLLMIAPVILLFYLVFGTMGNAASSRAGPMSTGLALGLVLAWALGVSFPLFET